jgi:hypothetical protein
MQPASMVKPARLAALALATAVGLSGCASAQGQRSQTLAPAVEKITYYPSFVKGYQGTYPKRRVLVLTPIEARPPETGEGNGRPPQGAPSQVGVVLGRLGQVRQRLYSKPLVSIVEAALVQAAEEAGLAAQASTESLSTALQKTDQDYLLVSRITRCWVVRRPNPDPYGGAPWLTKATFALDVDLYKPPFKVAFWQGTATNTYRDPAQSYPFLGASTEVSIYDDPAQVMSVALTRAVAGVFSRPALQALITQDKAVRR